MKLVSIIMPAYNCEKFISDAIESVILQTYKNWELEIIDDCSTDNTYKQIEPYLKKYPNIHYTSMSKNSGPAAARTEGINRSKGEFIAFLDSDDIWMPEKLESQLSYQSSTGVDLVCTSARCITNNGIVSDKYFNASTKIDYHTLLKGNDIICSSVLIKKDVIVQYPMIRSDLHEDYICWLSILKNGYRAAGLSEPLIYYRLTDNSKSRNKIKSARMTYQVYKYMELPFGARCFYFVCYAIHGYIRYYR